MTPFASVIVDIAHENVAHEFTYRVPVGMRIAVGMRVRVPFGARTVEGVVLALPDTCGVPPEKLRDIIAPLEDYPALLPPLIALAREMAQKAHCPLAETLRLLLPAPMRGGRVREKKQRMAQSLVTGEALADALCANKRASKRQMLLKLLSDGEPHAVSELSLLVRAPGEALSTLEQAGLVRLFEDSVLRTPYAYGHANESAGPPLTPGQQEALGELAPALSAGRGRFLLHGITGSGKTEVYIRLVRQALAQGKGAIVLVPEIALTPQMVDWFRGRFGDAAAVLHSRLSPGERYDEWRRIRMGQARVAIGARSAVFAPVERLGVVIVDEEHEQTYLSDHHPRYDAREVAASRASREGAVLVLASATPSILSFAMAMRGDYTLLEMPRRVNERPLPRVAVVDMREELRLGNKGIFSALLRDRLAACLGAGDQAMLFLNRRGYAPIVNCRRCGHALRCAQCDVPLTYHQHDGLLHCHYCGATQRFPETCPACKSPYIRMLGVGTQKVEEELKRLFPGVAAIRMDIDTTAGKDAHYKLLSRFRAGEAQVLVGTQMIAKGLDFPSVTLVGAVLADLTLHLPDYRAPERTFQLLTQVAGRAGRASKPGEVVVQTYSPEHYAIRAAAAQDYRAFFEEEFARRKKGLYPPFTLMARLLVEADDPDAAHAVCQALYARVEAYRAAHPELHRRLLMVSADDAPIRLLRGKTRCHVLMKLLSHPDSDAALAFLAELSRGEYAAQVYLEINPASLA